MSSPKDLDGGAGNIFEIREYLDDSGSVSHHDVLDVSKEMEMMAKVFADIKEESREIDDDERFIRELALISGESEEGSSTINHIEWRNEKHPPEARPTCEDQGLKGREAINTIHQPTKIQVKKDEQRVDKKKTKITGWKSGFLSGKKSNSCNIKKANSIGDSSSADSPKIGLSADSITESEIETSASTQFPDTPGSGVIGGTPHPSGYDRIDNLESTGSFTGNNGGEAATAVQPAISSQKATIVGDKAASSDLPETLGKPLAFNANIVERNSVKPAPLPLPGKRTIFMGSASAGSRASQDRDSIQTRPGGPNTP